MFQNNFPNNIQPSANNITHQNNQNMQSNNQYNNKNSSNKSLLSNLNQMMNQNNQGNLYNNQQPYENYNQNPYQVENSLWGYRISIEQMRNYTRSKPIKIKVVLK